MRNQTRVLALCLVLAGFAVAVSYNINRHCPVCTKVVEVESVLTTSVCYLVGDETVVIHIDCFGSNRLGQMENFYSVKLGENQQNLFGVINAAPPMFSSTVME